MYPTRQMHIGYINDFWWVRKPKFLHACSDSKSKETLKGLIFFASKSTEKHKAIIRIVKQFWTIQGKHFLTKSWKSYKNIFIIKITNRFSFWMHMVFLVNLVHSSKYFTSFGIIHILMNENGVSFIRIHYGPFLSGNQKQKSWSLNYWIKPSLSWRTLLLRSTNSGFLLTRQ